MHVVKRLVALGAVLAAATSCGDVVRTGRSPVMLVIQQLTAAPGGGHGAGTFSGFLLSDVLVIVTSPAPCSTDRPCATVFDDSAQATLSLALKDIGGAVATTATSNNQVTITRVHIKYTRADGRNVQGVDVPYEFDAAATATVPPGGNAILTFELVRHVAKLEPPLLALQNGGTIINTIAEITFYGTDLVGNEVSATGSIQVNFGNFGD